MPTGSIKVYCPRCEMIDLKTELFMKDERPTKKLCAHSWWEIAYEFARKLKEVQDGKKDRNIR